MNRREIIFWVQGQIYGISMAATKIQMFQNIPQEESIKVANLMLSAVGEPPLIEGEWDLLEEETDRHLLAAAKREGSISRQILAKILPGNQDRGQ